MFPHLQGRVYGAQPEVGRLAGRGTRALRLQAWPSLAATPSTLLWDPRSFEIALFLEPLPNLWEPALLQLGHLCQQYLGGLRCHAVLRRRSERLQRGNLCL